MKRTYWLMCLGLLAVGSGCGEDQTPPKASSVCSGLMVSNDRLRSGEVEPGETFSMTFSSPDSTNTLRGDRLPGPIWIFRTSADQSDGDPDTVNWALQTSSALYAAPPVTGSSVPETWSLVVRAPSPGNFSPLPEAIEACTQGNTRLDADGTYRFDPPLTSAKVSTLRVVLGSDEAETDRLAKIIGGATFCEAQQTNCQVGLPDPVPGS